MAEIIYECCRDCRLLDVCDPNYNSEPPCFQKAMESQTTAAQQLKAEVLHLIMDDSYAISFQSFSQYRSALVKAIAKLSAV